MSNQLENLNIYLTNLGKYNEGELIGEWLSLPIEIETLKEVLEKIEIGEEYEEYFVADYESSVGLKLGEFESLDELNYLAHKLGDMDSFELDKYEKILEIESVTSIAEYINLTENMDCYDVLPNIESKYELGQYVMEEFNGDILEQLGRFSSYFDYEQYGHDIDIEWSGNFINGSYVYSNEEKSNEYYTGEREEIPDDYVITNFETEKKNSIVAKLIEKQTLIPAKTTKSISENHGIEL
ncbi:antirestriction protein ArdA [Listeria seeligeri]|uniref:antirestriction protein ArdA n=1 Tax=Listeria seeligeri TaxID=1640 RepID=UPI0031CC9B50